MGLRFVRPIIPPPFRILANTNQYETVMPMTSALLPTPDFTPQSLFQPGHKAAD